MKKYTDVLETEYFKRSKCKLTYVECDECGKKLFPNKDDGYIKVHTWHNDWGNDSCESHYYADMCKTCAAKFASQYISKVCGTREMEVSYQQLYSSATSIEGYVKITVDELKEVL